MVRTQSPERREKFLSSALKLFVAHGVQNTSTAEITRDAGTAAGTLFVYFPTKQDLIHELVLKISKDQSDYIKALLEPSLPARQTFIIIWNGTIRWFLDHMEAYQYVQQIRDSGIVAESVVQETGKYLSYYYDAIQKGLSENSIKPYPFDMIGNFLYYDIVGMMNLLQAHPDPAAQKQIIEMGFEIFWDGIKN